MSNEPETAPVDDFNFEWESLTFRAHALEGAHWRASDEWEERVAMDTTGYVSDPLTTSFTDLDLSEAQSTIRHIAGWADLDDWSGE